MMDLSVLYGGGPLDSAPLDGSDGPGLGPRSMPVPQTSQELQSSYRDSGGRAFNREDYGPFGNNAERLDDMPLFNGTSKLKGAPRKMMPGPQQKGPANVKRGYRRMWQQLSGDEAVQGQLPAGPQQLGMVAWRDTTVEDLVAIVQSLPHREPVVPAVMHGLYYQDSRGLAAMLKELSKSGHGQQALELFDWLQNLPPNHDLAPLADVFSFTTAISLCGGLRKMDFAVELLWKMRQRGINCNVHTYSCLMNVCIKNNDLDMALNVFQKLQADGLQANIVTFNTLIDAMGKAGRWQDAIGVLDIIDQQGVEPEARTFNTIIIACNLCGQPLQALEVYKKMCMRGIEATDTTYTALISAYAKADRLEDALAAYKIMISEGHRRNAITYTSLICAAEKSGQWQLALELFHRVTADSVAPNAAIFNAAMSACAQGAQAMEARRIYAAMKDGLCRPDALTLTSLATAYQRAGKWDWAEQVLNEVMETRGRPDAALYATIIEGLWQSGSQPQRLRALKRFNAALQGNVHGLAASISGGENAIEVVVPTLTPGATLLALHHVLSNLQNTIRARPPPDLSRALLIILGRSQRLPRDGRNETAAAQQAGLDFLSSIKCPYMEVPDSVPKQLQAGFGEFVEWLLPLNVDAAIGLDTQASHPGSQDLKPDVQRFGSPGLPPIESLGQDKGGMGRPFQSLPEKSSLGQASVASDSGSLHSLPAYSYLAKPFEPPSGQASGRSKPSLQPCASKEPEGSSGPHTPSHADLLAPEGLAVPLSAPHPTGTGLPEASTAPPGDLMQPFRPIAPDTAGIGRPINIGKDAAAAKVAPEHVATKAASCDMTSEDFRGGMGAFGRLPRTGSQPEALSTSLSVPETGSTSSMLALHKTSSHPSSLGLTGPTWMEPAGTACPPMPILPSPESWATGVDHFGQPGHPVGSLGPSGAGDPALQARLVSILEALGQGVNQQPASLYMNAPVDALPAGYNPLVSLPGLSPHDPISLVQLHQTFAGPVPTQPASSALMSQIMMDRLTALELGNQNSSVYNTADPGLPYLPEMYPAPGDPQMGPFALPPEHIAAWQAAWLQQPLSAASNTYQG